ncbi:MAG: peptidylprolyl isomerase [Myxococcales bacterium]|nr:peptidylprolyl isomerase [Myxococcales bacterium]MCB9531177.1 peptidylprolyl isomerase [Myxococcales bacterium]
MSHPRRTAALVALLITAGVASPAAVRAEVIDRIIAQVDDGIVTQTDIVRLLPIYIEVYGVGPDAFASRGACRALVDDVIDFVITSRLLAADARRRQLEVSPAEIDAYIAEQYNRLQMTEGAFVAELASSGIDIADFREFIELNLNRVRMLQVEVAARVNVSEQDIDRAIQERYPDGLVSTLITTSHIFVQVQGDTASADATARAEIEDRARRLREGESFESVAQDNGDGTRRTGGSIGQFATTDLDPEYSRAALGLEVGEVSGPVRSSFGYHLIRLEAVTRGPVANADRVRDAIRFELQNSETENQQRAFLERVRADAFVEVRTHDFGYCDSFGR